MTDVPDREGGESVTRDVTAILLAAGSGSRFGGGKLLADFDGRPLLEVVLSRLEAAPVEEVVAVVGAEAGRVGEICKRRGVRTVFNPEWERGMSTSVLTGLAGCGPETAAAVVLLGDQPLVSAVAVERLVAAFREGARVAVATYDGRRRNPALFSREVWPLLERELGRSSEKDSGAREFIRRHPEQVVEVPCEDVSDPADVDTVEDLEGLRWSEKGGNVSPRERRSA